MLEGISGHFSGFREKWGHLKKPTGGMVTLGHSGRMLDPQRAVVFLHVDVAPFGFALCRPKHDKVNVFAAAEHVSGK